MRFTILLNATDEQGKSHGLSLSFTEQFRTNTSERMKNSLTFDIKNVIGINRNIYIKLKSYVIIIG